MYLNTIIKTFNASKLLLISAPSILVCLSADVVSAPLSLPARSIRENFPCISPLPLLFCCDLRMSWKTAWDLDEWALADVCPDVLFLRKLNSHIYKSFLWYSVLMFFNLFKRYCKCNFLNVLSIVRYVSIVKFYKWKFDFVS